MQPFEKLGSFYLGKEYDLAAKKLLEHLVMYDARDLTTHAVCVGMTGSGKTGLCIDLLEEAAIDSVPAIIIDPKGDITNMLLAFPDLRPEDFAPWVNPDDARRKDMTTEQYAKYIAQTWQNGLKEWDQGSERIRMFKQSADFLIYTPGSDAGLSVSILSSLSAPKLSWSENEELLRDKIQGTVSALIGLVGIDADPIRSREHILLSNIFENFWRRGEDLDLAKLIAAIQTPPVRQLGVFDTDTFFPEKERFELAMLLNNIIAAPSFDLWLQGEPFDISRILYSPDGKPRHSIFYIAHLSDQQRMFFVTLLLEQVLTWVRQQSGTTSLRALLYFDEVFGFFPPVANPPSKKPLLTLLKQARAFGFGVVLTTQNPVDLDYKGLTNAGAWFIGKLQTDRDKMRVLDGLESAISEAGSKMNRRQLNQSISSLGTRVFLLHNVHADHAIIFQTRWAMSYLRGPLTRIQLKDLMAGITEEKAPAAAATQPSAEPMPRPSIAAKYTEDLPRLSPELPQTFLPVRVNSVDALTALAEQIHQKTEQTQSTLVYEPSLLAWGNIHFIDRKIHIDELQKKVLLVDPSKVSGMIRWEDAECVDIDPTVLAQQPEADARFGPVPKQLNTPAKFKALSKDFLDYLCHQNVLNLYYHAIANIYGQPYESEHEFRIRVQHFIREKRDAEVDKLRRKYTAQLQRLESKLYEEQQELTQDQARYAGHKREEIFSAGESIISVLGVFGRRRPTTAFSKAARKRRMTAKAKADVDESVREIARLQNEVQEIRSRMEHNVDDINDLWATKIEKITTYKVRPKKSDCAVEMVSLTWIPYWEIGYRTASGTETSARISAWRKP
ncbi:MAG: type IV secretion system DNA-binding domain-containing protein [candidate division WOR-3 bacterium]|nr:MAG: type IV secretion system DNA-binding domain-containing protein [candidate division WOR-3 bacterium]